ncbi:putative enzymatic polyprotein, partial [Sesamum angolense]
MEFTGNVMEMQLIPKEEILEELSRLREEIAVTMKWIHIGTIEVVMKATFKEGIDSEIHLSIMDRRINNLRDGCLGTMIGNLYAGKLMFDIHPRIAYNLADQDFSRVLTLHQDFKRKDLMKEGKSISKFPEFSRNLLRIIGYKGKEKDLSKVLTPQEIRQPVIGRYEGMLEIAGHEILVTGVAGRENESMILGISFLEDHKPWGRKGNGADILLGFAKRKAFNRIMPINFRSKRGDVDAKLTHPKMQDKRKFGKVLLSFRQQGLIDSDSFYEESEEEIKNLKEAMRENKIKATLKIKEECKYEYVRYKPIQMNMEDKKDMQMIIKEHINLGLIEPGISAYSSPGFLIKMENESKKFTAFSTPQGQYIWNVLPMGLANAPQIFQRKMDNLFKDYFEFMFVYIDDILIASKNMKEHIQHLEIFSNACYKEGLVLSEKKATIAVNKIEFLGILIDEAGIELQEHIVEKIRNFPDITIQSFFIKDLAKYRKDFRPLLKETESAKWKWEEIHTQRVRELNRHLRENLEELNNKFGRLAVNAQVAGQIQRADLDTVQIVIRTTMVASTSLWNDLQESIRKASSSEMTNELKKHDTKHALRVQDSRPVAADSSTTCIRPSSDSGETATNESQGVKTSDDSSQPSTSGVKEGEISLKPMTGTSKANTNELSSSSSSAWQVYQRMWEKLISHKRVNPSKTIIETSGKYNRVWMMEGSKPEEVRE